MNKGNAIEVRNMTKVFKNEYDKPHTLKELLLHWHHKKGEDFVVLKDINIDIKKGETVALIGTNGSGKSTLLKLMTQIIYPNVGTIETDGKLTSLLELGAGFHPDFTGRENIYFNAAIFGLTKEEIDRRIEEIIEFSELGTYIDNPIRTYSSGMYMRLAFSVAINVDADILLVDEILAVGDQHFQEKCFDKLAELKNSAKTIVIVTHSLDVVKKLCDRAIWIYKGEFRLDGDPIYVIDEYLKQVAEDHQKEKREAVAKGTDKYHGTIFVDHPKDFATFQNNINLDCHGWALSDCPDAKLTLSFDNEEVEFERFPRPDVSEMYAEQYGGYIDESKVGWKTWINLSEKTIGEHSLDLKYTDDNDTVIAEKTMVITVKD